MKPVFQTDFSFQTGNCFSACIASLLELSIDEVPCFMGPGIDWFAACNDWMAKRGFTYIEMKWSDAMTKWFCNPPTPILAIGTGSSPRNRTKLHCVVVELIRDGIQVKINILHDPHPSNEGIFQELLNSKGEVVNSECGLVGFIVKLNPKE